MTLGETIEVTNKIIEEEAKRLYPDNDVAQKAYIAGANFGHLELNDRISDVRKEKEIVDLKAKYANSTLEDLEKKIEFLEYEIDHTYNLTTTMIDEEAIREIRNVISNKWYKL